MLQCLLKTLKMLQFSQYNKSGTTLFIINADLEFSIKTDGYKYNP